MLDFIDLSKTHLAELAKVVDVISRQVILFPLSYDALRSLMATRHSCSACVE